jgi:hypothetical protein
MYKAAEFQNKPERDVTTELSRQSRLFVLSVLLDHTLSEGRELALPHLDKLLGAAALAVSDELNKEKAASPRTEASGRKPLREM